MTLRALAAAIGFPGGFASLNKVELGTRDLNGEEATLIAKHFGCSTDWILRGEESGTSELMERVRMAERDGLDESGERTVLTVLEQQVAESRLRRATLSPQEAEILELLKALGGQARIEQELQVLRQERQRREGSQAGA